MPAGGACSAGRRRTRHPLRAEKRHRVRGRGRLDRRFAAPTPATLCLSTSIPERWSDGSDQACGRRSRPASRSRSRIANRLGLEYPLYAMIAAIIVTDLAPEQSRRLGLQRLVGTVVGAACGAALSSAAVPGLWTAAAGILFAMHVCQLLDMEARAKLAGFVCGIVLRLSARNAGPAHWIA